MKKYLALILVILILFVGIREVFAEGEENGDEIKTFGQVLEEVGLMKGDGTGLNVHGQLTREEMVTIINRLYKEESVEDFILPEKSSFTDVPKNHWAYKQIEFAYAKGISKGVSASEFGLGQKINGNQAALFLIRIMGYDDEIMGEKIDYKDAYRKVYLLLDIKMLKKDNNIFVESINDITSEEMEDISWDELNNLLADKLVFDLKMWAPHRDSPDEHSYLYPYKAKDLVVIDTLKADFEFNYDRPAEEGMDWENVTYSYDIKNIQVDKKTQSKFVFRIRIADDQYQNVDLFFVFEYDSKNKKVIKAASCNTMGFAVLD